MFNLFRRNCLYNESIEPHCAYCAHCKPDNEYQGVCSYRGIVAMAGSCRRFEYDALRRRPPKPARIRGRFTDADFFFEDLSAAPEEKTPDAEQSEEHTESPEPDAESAQTQEDGAETDTSDTPAEPEESKEGGKP